MIGKPIVVLASSNKHKIKEIGEILKDFTIVPMKEVGFTEDIVEDGKTLLENSMIKAKAIRSYLHQKGLDYPVIADDSGLFCNGLNGEPGVYSARYSGIHGDDEANRQTLLKNLKGIDDRSAYFCCTMVLLDCDNTYFTGVGKTFGSILTEYQGDTSFGYDCLFHSDDLKVSFGTATDEEKNSVSHRYRALMDLLQNIKEGNRNKLILSDIEIARSVKPKDIVDVARDLGLSREQISLFGDSIAKVKVGYSPNAKSNLILVASINPTSAGNGKTTVSIGLADALKKMGKKVCLALREPSMGPVFGMKGGATGGGYSQVIPMEDINLHFTGDFHAITSANNLLSSAIDNHIFQGNAFDIDENNILFNRCIDLNDRALRRVKVEITKGETRDDKFNITASSEVMAILCMSKDIEELKAKLGNIMVALTKDGKPVYVRDLHVEESMAIILKDAIKPNLVQTLAGTPALVHLGPFANIAHGCNSIMATNIAMQYSDYTITEAGFGADLGAEKFIDFKCREMDIKPNCIVIVATIPALKLHGGVDKSMLKQENIDAVVRGFANLRKHIENIRNIYHTPCVVTLNSYSSDTMHEIVKVKQLVEEMCVPYSLNTVWANGGDGAIELAEIVINSCKENYRLEYAYDLNSSVEEKIQNIATKIYGASNVIYMDKAKEDIKNINRLGLANLPIIIAKTQYSLSDNKDLLGAPKDFDITVRNIEIRSGAGVLVVCLGTMLLMPGLNKTPAYMGMKIDNDGKIDGLY